MPRIPRQISPTGIYHVMMRGNNRQNIFLDLEDRRMFLKLLHGAATFQYNISGRKAAVYEIYAYALMSNHFHIMVRVVNGKIGELVKKLAAGYVLYFNKKYHRDGHLFKERFRSEICEYTDYFETLLAYIHQNPIKAGLCQDLLEYNYTSWAEYAQPSDAPYKICSTEYVLEKMPFEKLEKLVYKILPDNVRCVDVDKTRGQIPDHIVTAFISSKFGINDPAEVKTVTKAMRDEIISAMLEYGAVISQISRLTGVSKSTISSIATPNTKPNNKKS